MLPAAHAGWGGGGGSGSGGGVGSSAPAASELQRLQQLGSQTTRSHARTGSNSTLPPPPLARSALQLPRAAPPPVSPHSARLAAVRQSLQDNGAYGAEGNGPQGESQQIARWVQRSMDVAPTEAGRTRDIARHVEELFFPPKPSHFNGAVPGRAAPQRLAPPSAHSMLSPLGRSSSTGWLEAEAGAGAGRSTPRSMDASNQNQIIHALRMEVDALKRQTQAHLQQDITFQELQNENRHLRQLKPLIQQLEHKLAEMKEIRSEQIQQHAGQMSSMGSQLEELAALYEGSLRELALVRDDNARLARREEEMSGARQQAQAQADEYRTQVQTQSEALQSLEKAHATTCLELESTSAQLSSLRVSHAHARAELEARADEISTMHLMREMQSDALSDAQAAAQDALHRMAQLQREAEGAADLPSLRLQLIESQQECTLLQQGVTKLQTRCDTLEALVEEFESREKDGWGVAQDEQYEFDASEEHAALASDPMPPEKGHDLDDHDDDEGLDRSDDASPQHQLRGDVDPDAELDTRRQAQVGTVATPAPQTPRPAAAAAAASSPSPHNHTPKANGTASPAAQSSTVPTAAKPVTAVPPSNTSSPSAASSDPPAPRQARVRKAKVAPAPGAAAASAAGASASAAAVAAAPTPAVAAPPATQPRAARAVASISRAGFAAASVPMPQAQTALSRKLERCLTESLRENTRLTSQIAQLQMTNKSLAARERSASQSALTHTSQLEQLSKQHARLQRDHTALERTLSNKEKRVEELLEELSDAELVLQGRADTLRQRTRENHDLRAQVVSLEANGRLEAARLQLDLRNVNQQLNSELAAHESMARQLGELQAELQVVQAQHGLTLKAKEGIATSLQKTVALNSDLSVRLANCEAAAARSHALEEKCTSLEGALERSDQMRHKQTADMETLQKTLQSLSEKHTEQTTALQRATAKVNSTGLENAKLITKIQSLQAQLHSDEHAKSTSAGQLKLLTLEATAMRETMQQLEAEVEDERKQQRTRMEQYRSARKELVAANTKITALRKSEGSLRTALEKELARNKRVEAELVRLRTASFGAASFHMQAAPPPTSSPVSKEDATATLLTHMARRPSVAMGPAPLALPVEHAHASASSSASASTPLPQTPLPADDGNEALLEQGQDAEDALSDAASLGPTPLHSLSPMLTPNASTPSMSSVLGVPMPLPLPPSALSASSSRVALQVAALVGPIVLPSPAALVASGPPDDAAQSEEERRREEERRIKRRMPKQRPSGQSITAMTAPPAPSESAASVTESTPAPDTVTVPTSSPVSPMDTATALPASSDPRASLNGGTDMAWSNLKRSSARKSGGGFGKGSGSNQGKRKTLTAVSPMASAPDSNPT